MCSSDLSLTAQTPPPPAPRAPVIPAQRLYSATSSYTVAASVLDSAPYQLRPDTAQTKPDYFRHSADFTVGGPVRVPGRPSSRANVTLSYSGIRGNNLFDQYATVPTAAMRAGDISALGAVVFDPLTGAPFPGGIVPPDRLSPAAMALLKAYPLPNGEGIRRNFHRTSTNRSTQDTLNLRFTQPLIGTSPSARGRGPRGDGQTAALSAQLNAQIDFRRNINDRLNALPSIRGVGENRSLRIPVSLNVTRRGSQHAFSASVTDTRNDTRNRYAGVEDIGASLGMRPFNTPHTRVLQKNDRLQKVTLSISERIHPCGLWQPSIVVFNNFMIRNAHHSQAAPRTPPESP